MALSGRKIENFDDISLSAWSRGLPICVSSTSFQKNDIGWPQQPLTERVSDISEKLDFWWSIPQKGNGSDHLGDQTIRISKKFDKTRLSRSVRPLRLLRPLRSSRLQRFKGLENYYWGLQIHPGIWIQLYFYVLKKVLMGRIMKYHVEF